MYAVAIAGILLIGIGIVPAFAQTTIVTPSIGWHFNNALEDFGESIGFDIQCLCTKSQAELQVKHAFRQQVLIEQLERDGKAIPFEVEERRLEKLQQSDVNMIDVTSDKKRNFLEDAQAKLLAIGEVNEIRILYSQLDTVRDSDDETKKAYNDRINNSKWWQEFCSGTFDVNYYQKDQQSWDKIKKRCFILNQWEATFGFDNIKNYISGDI